MHGSSLSIRAEATARGALSGLGVAHAKLFFLPKYRFPDSILECLNQRNNLTPQQLQNFF